MRYLSQIIVFLLLSVVAVLADSPHGANFNLDCAICHSPEGWGLLKNSTFNHDTTSFMLTGQHKMVSCKQCHTSLKFDEAPSNCIQCHSDIHANTVGQDCDQCHSTNSWIITEVTEMHMKSRFPLVGAHALADCYDCHKSVGLLQFEPMGTDCYDCHKTDFANTTNPNHITAGFSTECAECHRMDAMTWSSKGIDHSFFPLTQGHNIAECAQCHTNNNYTGTSSDCFSCHKNDYNTAQTPSHTQSGFSQNCTECHTTAPGWSPAVFSQHDAVFPIYSGEHKGEWSNCNECHTVAGDFSQFNCTACHEHNRSAMDSEHRSVSGYAYNSQSCYACHPQGSSHGAFNHNLTNFPLTGEHRNADCLSCHADGYQGTSTECYSCHASDYMATKEPPHAESGFSTGCDQCHTTNAGWAPANFAEHDNYFALRGAHAAISTDCNLCHKNGYTNASSNCYSCHSSDYASTTEPSHSQLGFSTDCQSCHTDNSWSPSSFNHDSYYPLTGAHAGIKNNCKLCHANGYENTPTDCYSCHKSDYTTTTEPPHVASGFSTDCESCHTVSGWSPSSFNHDKYWALNGAHANIATECKQCHASGYTNTSSECNSCHASDYNNATNPNHKSAGFPTACEECHSVSAWEPATFNHDSKYFPIYSGEHRGEWSRCTDCHTNASNFGVFSCTNCHEHSKSRMDGEHDDVRNYVYNSTNCFSCHPTGKD